MAEADDILKQGKDLFSLAQDAEGDNRRIAEEDISFAREGKQWPDDVVTQRKAEQRPILTINKMPAFIRQVVNDARMNKPAVKVHPADSGADPDTADLLNGLIRNIEYTSNADVAYDTAIESAVSGGFGYWRVTMGYAYDDSFDMDLAIKRVANPFSVYGDPNSLEADSSDWMNAFVVERFTKAQFEAKYGSKSKTNWDDADAWGDADWREGNEALVAEWWSREEAEVKIGQFLDNRSDRLVTFSIDQVANDEDVQLFLQQGILELKRERVAKTFKVKQRIMSGAEVLEENAWPGTYIPIIPVYGDEINIKGKRLFHSLIHPSIDAQRMFNYWRTTSTELVALAPRVPFIGPKGFADADPNWDTANTRSHAYLEYDGIAAPQRQPLDSGVAAGALQEALNASDDMKAIMGIYDASLGARSNETSGRAIIARQREGDVSTFHFIDNLSRAIRHTGRVLIDLIPHVYNGERMVRVMGEDGKPETKPLNQEYQKTDPKTGQPLVDQRGQAIMAIHDLSAGKYDVTVTTGPSFTTRREEAAFQMTEMIRALPAAAPIVGKHLAKNLDWPGADEIGEELEAMSAGPPPEVQQKLQEQEQTIQQLKGDQSAEMAKLQQNHAFRMQELRLQQEYNMAKLAMERQVKMAATDTVEVEGEDGSKTVRSKAEVASDATTATLAEIRQLQITTIQGLEQLVRIAQAPSELEIDPATGRKRARKVLTERMN